MIVANRIQKIRGNTDMQHWCYVLTGENPADSPSRGLNRARVDSESCWFQWPPFLCQNEGDWSGVRWFEVEVLTDDTELRWVSKSCAAFVHEDIIFWCLEGRISCWLKLNRVIGLMLIFQA